MSEPLILTSPLLDQAGVRHAFFTRQGGVSQGIYAGLNVGQGSGDDSRAFNGFTSDDDSARDPGEPKGQSGRDERSGDSRRGTQKGER